MSYQLRTESMRHQSTAVARAMKKPDAFAYLAETGTGKTHMVLAEFQQRFGKDIRHLLVLAPASSIRNWYQDKTEDEPSELKKHLDPKLFEQILIMTNRNKAVWRQRLKMMAAHAGPCALFVNIEALSTGNAKYPGKAEVQCRDFLKKGGCMMVIDESTTIRSKSRRTQTVMRLGQLAHCRRILTGLVTPKSPLDLYYQMNFLDPAILNQPSFTNFRARYAKLHYLCREPTAIVDMRLRQAMRKRNNIFNFNGMKYEEKVAAIFKLGGWIQSAPIVTGFQHIEELQKLIAPFCYQVLKKDCLDLKPKSYQFRYIEFTEEQKRVYKEIQHDAISKLDNGSFVTVDSVIKQIIRLHQIVCGHVKDEAGNIQDLGTNRMKALNEILDEHEGKAIIWVTYDYELRRIVNQLAEYYGEHMVAAFWGGNPNTRDEHEVRFLTDPNCRFMVSTPMSGGRGNTWTVADLAIYAANNHNLEHRFQSEDRCHRYGQENKVTYIDIMVPATVEEKIIKCLRKKIDLNTLITGENYREWLV
jgi:SNF2 family DNA or RNA helicase